MTDETTTTPPSEAEEPKKAQKAETSESQKTEDKSEQKRSENTSKGNDRRDRRGRRGGGNRRKQREQKEFEESILQIDRVTRVVKGGRRMRFRISVVIGDKKGRVGFGVGKASEVLVAIQKAVARAKKNLFRVPIFNDTIPHEIVMHYKSTKVMLFPAPEGKGVIAGGAVRKILELAGVKDVLSKVHGSRNKLNVARCTFKALERLRNEAPLGSEEAEEDTVEDDSAATNTETAQKTEQKSPAKKTDEKKTSSQKKSTTTKKSSKKSPAKKDDK